MSTNTVAAVFILLCISSLPQIVDVIIDGIRAIVVIAKNLTKLISVAETIYVKISLAFREQDKISIKTDFDCRYC